MSQHTRAAPGRDVFGVPPVGALDAEASLRHRLEDVNSYFKRKAADVFTDESAVRLLANLYRSSSAQFSDLDTSEFGIPLAKLTAAGFCEIGGNAVQISDSGREFVESIQNA